MLKIKHELKDVYDNAYESYVDFIDHARNIRGYGNWHYTSKKALKDLNEWLTLDNLGPVTQEEMKEFEECYIKNKEEAFSRYWAALMGHCYVEQSEQEEYSKLCKEATK